jgi:hypothetical protein
MTRRKRTPETAHETAKRHYAAWLEAELELTTHQSYKIGTRSMTKADLAEVRKQLQYWKNEVTAFENAAARKGRSRIIRVVPRDL